MNSMKIGTYQMDTTFGLYLPEYTIPAPAVQTNFVKIIGRDGSVDLSNALGLHYDSRTWSLDFKCFDPTVNWHTLSSQVMNAIHGKRLNFEFDDDPNYFWTGRVSVQNYVSNHGTGTLKVTIVSDPFKYAKLSTIVTKTASTGTEYTGELVTFNTANAKINDLSVTIQPIQDLHGYANPWPAGGGKNLLNNTATTNTINGVTFTVNTDGSVTVSGTATGTVALNLGTLSVRQGETYTISGSISAYNSTQAQLFCESEAAFPVGNRLKSSSGLSITATALADETIFVRIYVYQGTSVTGTFYPQIEFGSTATEYAPYSNICPITGRTGVDAFVAPNASMWSKYKLYVDTGAASELMPVGKQITDTWKNTGGTEISFPWDVVHYTSGGDAFLKLHYAAPEALQFDAPEAIYYFDGTETAGTYHIEIGFAYGTGWVVGHSIQFTLTAAPDEGDQLFIDCRTNNANDPTDGCTWKVFAAGDTTAKQSGTTSNGTDGTSLGTIGSVNAHRPNGRLNAISRVVYGYARWSQSAMRQYFNSAEVNWWTMKNPWDRPPAQASTIRGFLCGFSQDFFDHLEETEVVTALNTQEGFAEATETTMDKIFLPSLEQMYINPQLAWVEGESWDYYKELAEEAGLSGKFQTGQTYPILITYNASNTSSAVTVFLRSCSRGYAANEWIVNPSGHVYDNSAGYATRGCPACKFKKSAPDGVRYTTDWVATAGTVYGGTVDVVTGVLTVDRANIASYNGEVINEPWLSSMDTYVEGATPTTGAQVVYTLATPLTYQLTPQEVEALVGTNNVWSDGGNVTVAVVTPETLTNNGRAVVPTLTASADMVLKWGNYSASVQQGTSTIPQLILENGANLIYIIGTGSISFTWQEARL